MFHIITLTEVAIEEQSMNAQQKKKITFLKICSFCRHFLDFCLQVGPTIQDADNNILTTSEESCFRRKVEKTKFPQHISLISVWFSLIVPLFGTQVACFARSLRRHVHMPICGEGVGTLHGTCQPGFFAKCQMPTYGPGALYGRWQPG